jgi:glycosyltransferase involved in cell wall biosynthesis
MRIGIDARCLEWQRGGPARYLINMLKHWPRMSAKHTYVLFFRDHAPDDDFLKNDRFEHVVIKGPRFLKTRRIVEEQLLLPGMIRESHIDLFFTPWYSAPLVTNGVKTVIGLWDISPTTHSSHYTLLERISFGYFIPQSSKKAAGVLTCSAYDGRQIERYYGIPPERICVVPYAADDKFSPADDPAQLESFRRKYGFPERYILSMGIIIKRRDIDVKIDAFSDIHEEYPDVGLVVVGRNVTVPFVNIREKLRPLIEKGRAFYLERAPEEDLVNFYRAAWYYICTSTTDGESLMLKEALQCGTPVVTSPFLMETAGDNAVLLQDPTSRSETADVFRKVLNDRDLRQRCAIGGLNWMKGLSWEKVAEDSLRFLERSYTS